MCPRHSDCRAVSAKVSDPQSEIGGDFREALVIDGAETITPKDRLRGIIAFIGRHSDHLIAYPFCVAARIELPRAEIPAPLNRPVVRHLDDPGAARALRAIEDHASSLNKNKEVLDQVFRLTSIPQNA